MDLERRRHTLRDMSTTPPLRSLQQVDGDIQRLWLPKESLPRHKRKQGWSLGTEVLKETPSPSEVYLPPKWGFRSILRNVKDEPKVPYEWESHEAGVVWRKVLGYGMRLLGLSETDRRHTHVVEPVGRVSLGPFPSRVGSRLKSVYSLRFLTEWLEWVGCLGALPSRLLSKFGVSTPHQTMVVVYCPF